MKRKLCSLLAIAGLFCTAVSARAGFQIYLQTEDPVIQGEVTAKAFPNAWQLLSFSQGITVPSDGSAGGGGGTAVNPEFSDVAVAKFVDKASALLLLRAAQGGRIGRVTISFYNETTPLYTAYKIVLEDAYISEISQQSGDLLSPHPVNEAVKVNFRRITWTYTPLNSNGSLGTPITTSWDVYPKP
jgi:type VI secretion system Hcp family effector